MKGGNFNERSLKGGKVDMILTEKQKKYFENFILALSDGDKAYNICEECGKDLNIRGIDNAYLQDTGICSVCKKIEDVINPKIAEEVIKKGVDPVDYWNSGCKRLANSEDI